MNEQARLMPPAKPHPVKALAGVLLLFAVGGAVALTVANRFLNRGVTQRDHLMPAKNWPPPGFPLVEGNHALTATWRIQLPEQFARRVEDGQLVLWRPGLTLWLVAWGNDNRETQAGRLARIKGEASPARFDARESTGGGLTRFSYRLRDENADGPVESLSAYVIGDEGHLQVSVYFDDVADAGKAQQLVESVALRRRE